MTPGDTTCEGHARRVPGPLLAPAERERAARIFRAMGDPERLKLLELLSGGESCVSELAGLSGVGLSTLSQRLKLLRLEGLVSQRREGKHIYYALADQHVVELLQNAASHAREEHFSHDHDHEESTR